jgi:hypothetical protein
MQFYKYSTKRSSGKKYSYVCTIKLVKETEEQQFDGTYITTEVVCVGYAETRERAQIWGIGKIRRLERGSKK